MAKNKIKLDYYEEITTIGVSVDKEKYHIKLYDNDVTIIKDDNGYEVKFGSELYDKIMLFCVQSKELNY